MSRDAYLPYAPLGVLKPFAEELWIADGPEVRMHYWGVSLPFPTRMTVARLPGGDLWVHSPVAWNEQLGHALAALGPVRHIVAPNSLHYSWLGEWQARYPAARSYGLPGFRDTAHRPIAVDESLRLRPPDQWGGAFAQCIVPGSLLTEVEFFHQRSRTLVLTDLIENFEPRRVRSRLLRWLIRLSGAADPDGKAPIDMRWSFHRHRAQVRAAAETMIGWAPERIILAHGRCYERDGTAELRRAFRWVLPRSAWQA